MSSNITQWGSFDLDAAEEEKEELAAMGGGAFLKVAAGRNIWRFMPPPLGKRTPFVKAHQHYIEVPGQPTGVSFNCPRVMDRRYCPACAEVDKLKSTGNKADYDAAMKMAAKLRVYANVISRANPDMGPQIVAFGKTIYEPLLALREDTTTGGDYTHPEQGFDIVVTKVGEKMNTKYTVTPARDTTPLGDLEWIGMQADLTRFGIVPTDEEINAKIADCAFGSGGRGGRGGAPAQMNRGGGGARQAPAGRQQPQGGPPRGRGRNAEDDAMNPEEG